MLKTKGPIFIGGLDRCGKTLLRALLVSHPQIAIPEIGSNYWTFFYRRYGDLSQAENFERCLADMQRYTHVTLLNPNFSQIRRDFQQAEPTYERLFALFNQQYAQQQGKPRWGDQTGLIERFADQVLAAYPGSKMLHMIRDPRDRYEASVSKHPHGKGKIGGATGRWLLTTSLAERNQEQHPDRYKIIQYETLVCKPEQTLQEICAFLEEDYCTELLEMSGAPEFRDKIRKGAYGKAGPELISTDFIGRYKQSVSKDELAYMQWFAGKRMQAYGYKLEETQFSTSEWIQFLFKTVPDNWLRMATWLTVEKIQHHFPAQFGRTPPRDKIRLVNV